jgi:hypothetical protein
MMNRIIQKLNLLSRKLPFMNKIDIKTIRIGSLLKQDILDSTKIVETDLSVLEYLINGCDETHSTPIYYEPIPITEEKLIRLGFVDPDNIKVFFMDQIDLEQHYIGSEDWGVYINEDESGCSIKYIHELQNIVYDLLKKELVWK